MTFAGAETFEMLRAVDLLEVGLAPVSGGSLDQTRVFNQAARFITAERQWYRNDNRSLRGKHGS
jgi:uncharacterized protein YlxP (DUF503 family)